MTDSRGPIIRDTAPFLLPTEHLSFLVLLLSLSLFRRASLSEITSRVPNRKIIMPRLTRCYHRTVANNSNPLCPDVSSLSLPGVPANQRWITDNSKKGKKKAVEEVEDRVKRVVIEKKMKSGIFYSRSRSRHFQLPENW